MAGFFITLWVKWAIRISLCSVISAFSISFFIMLFIYISQDMPTLESEVLKALFDITMFWFPIVWSLTLLLSLFRSLKYIFNSCCAEYKLQLLTCDTKEFIEVIGYGDLVKVWRRWFMLIIWLVGAQMIFSTAFAYLFMNIGGVFSWFNIYWLYAFILIAGYLSFVLLSNRCKRVKVIKC